MVNQTDKQLVKRLRSDHGTLAGLIEAAQKAATRIEKLGSEVERIKAAIQRRIDTHSDFVELCHAHNIEPTTGLFSAIAELRSLQREMEKGND